MKVRLLFVVLLLGAAAREQLKNFSSNQDKYLEMHVKLRESEPSQRILNGNASQQDSINMFIIENKLTSNNKDIWRHERGLPRSNNRELEKNHDYGFEYKTDLYESDGKQKARLLNYKNVRRKKNALNELEKESMKYQELKNHENVQSPPSTSENLNETSLAQDEAAQNSRVDDLNEGGLEKYRPNPSSVAHQEDENVSLEEVEAHPVNARRTSASPQKDDFNDTLSTLSLKKTDAETCRFGMHIGQELSLNGDNYGRITCFMCYLVIPKHRKKIELQLEYSTHTFSYENRTKEPFDPSSSVSWAIIRGSLISDVEADKLENCCAEATDCCSTISQETTGTPDAEGDFCPATWDGWSCFSVPVPAGMTVPVKCPVHAYSGYPECYRETECCFSG
ncbi:hypothetical protein FHG87_009452 [Trinorchestia longiramus]|nr:hypothetical protein FHG87_009452 [Trinorchestia longiramus]